MTSTAPLLEALDVAISEAADDVKRRRLAPLERDLIAAFRSAWELQRRAFLRRLRRFRGWFPTPAQDGDLEEAIGPRDWEPLFDEAAGETFRLFEEPLDVAVRAALAEGAAFAIAAVGLDLAFDLRNPRAVDFLRDQAANQVRRIDDTTRQYLRTIITKAADKGWSYNRLARRITERYEEFSAPRPQEHIRNRAELIATTELGNAYEEGNLIVAQDLQDGRLPVEKRWLTVGDDRVDPHCQANGEAGWIPLDRDFPSGVKRPLDHPG